MRALVTDRLRAVLAPLLIAALLTVPGGYAAGATRDFYFEAVGTERGLTQSSVSSIVQDPLGFIWVGTQGGLHRYDGQRYRVYRHDPQDPASLPDSFVTALDVDASPALWVGTFSQYVARLDLRTGTIRRYLDAAPDRRADRQVLTLHADRDAIWIGTVSGLDRLDPATGRRQRVLDLPARAASGAPNQQLRRDRAGNLWYATGQGLFRVDGLHATRVGSAEPAYALQQGQDGRLWLGGEHGLEQVTTAGRVHAWPTDGGAAQIRAMVQTRDGRLWLSVYPDGLRRFDPATGDVVALREDRAVAGTLPENSVNTMYVDRSGLLWLGGQFRGAAVGDPRGAQFAFITDTGPHVGANPAADDSVRAVTGTPGALWYGTDGDRLVRYDLATQQFEDLSDRLPGGRTRVAGFLHQPDGHLLLATSNGLAELDPATRAIRRVDLPTGVKVVARSIARDLDGAIWIGTSGHGAYRYDAARGTLDHFEAGNGAGATVSHPNVHALLVDHAGRVWFGTGDGLDVHTPDGRMRHFRHAVDRADSLPSNVVRALYEGADGRIWVGTHAGLSEAVASGSAGDLVFRRPLDAALPDHATLTVFSLREGPRGTLWAGTDAGLLRYRPATHDARLFGTGEGLQDLEFNGGAAGTLVDGRLAFGGVRGINLVDPKRADAPAYGAPLRLLTVRAGNTGGGAPSLWPPTSLHVGANDEVVRLSVGALDFAPSAQPRYRYRMDGFDADWIDNGTQRDITYTHVPAGHHVFRAQATDRNGRWSPVELTLPIEVERPLWRHPLVIALVALLLLAPLVFAAYQWVQRRRRESVHLADLREREERLTLALWASGEVFWDYDLDRRVLRRMQARAADRDEPDIDVDTREEPNHRIHPEDFERVLTQLRRHLRGETPVFESQHRVLDPDGEWIWVRARGRAVERDDEGRAIRIAGTARDVSATRRAERDRRVASEVLRSMAEAVAVFDDDFRFISVNPAFTRMTGYTEGEVAGQQTSLIDSRQHDEVVYRQMREELQRDGRWSGELWQRRKDGSEFLCWLQASVVLDNAGQRGHWVAVLSDITDQKRAEQELRYLANYDTLTGLPNRALLLERLSRAIARARRQETRIAVLFLDLDRFKDINDSLGHAAGDAILRATAGRLRHALGGRHVVARLGGDEFTVVMEHVEDLDEAETVARQLLASFESPLDAGDLRDVIISPSIGVALYPDDADTPSDLLKHADTAMYQAKAQGRRTYMRYSGTMDVDIRRRATLSAALRKVIDRDELHLVYQPRLSLSQQRIVGVEALLRWNSSEFGAVSPAQFIPLAEESGLILEIGQWALHTACEQLQRWRDAGLDIAMAVNVSALQLRRGHLAGVIERLLADTGLPPDRLELELTESVIMAEETWSALQAIRDLGVHMSIDDFGTGYSSFAYLKRLPINALKIDREFIGDLTRDPDDEAITSAVIAMGHSLGLNVVAEGVETEGQLDFLRRNGCDEIQGYWLARPLDAEACEQFMREWRWESGIPGAP
ncbi:EAL domain-containing protein [Lysobacter sp. TY2-98]|uniref:EAL domain-containing protein n=1 Tax=Lysobacter sp. TY2-98 TaxID=2290922 RepID=UPI001F086333|nr:EAL domain-containing protein [Lysobacter sp. TY2-98]